MGANRRKGKRNMRTIRLAALSCALLAGLRLATPVPAQETNAVPVNPDAMKAWQDMRFGMFIHWGPVSLTGHEIGWARGAQTPIEEYDNLYKKFNPTNFNAKEWVAVAKAAGMKYMVLTTKHHDGFCLWDTKQTDYNIMNSPFGRDVVKELSAACKEAGIAFGTYYSTCDWHHPDFPRTSPGGRVKREKHDLEKYTEYLKAQVTELIKNYGPLVMLWFDVPQEFDRVRGTSVINLCRGLQPSIIVNNRTGAPGDYDTPEQRVGGFNMDRPWETCMTICRQWAWKPDDTMKSLQQCLQTLILTAGGNGNLLFNVGPMPDGRIEDRQIDRLKEMGAWLEKYGASIYDTRGGPYKPGKWGASTRKGRTVYLHIFKWDGDAVTLPALPAKVVKSRALTGGEAVVTQTAEGLTVSVPAANRQEIDTVIELELDAPAMDLAPIAVAAAGGSLSSGAKATASNVFQNNKAHYGPEKAVDDDTETRWATDAGAKTCWLELDLGADKTFSRIAIRQWEGDPDRVQSFEVKALAGEEWKTVLKGGKMGAEFDKTIDPVTARRVRLEILDSKDGPTIEEFQLFAK
jgi:alpha-L-fucosidase